MTHPDSNALRALVTGATGGIGRATWLALVEAALDRGRTLAIAAAASKAGPVLDALVAELKQAGARATGLAADPADAGACQQLAAQARRRGPGGQRARHDPGKAALMQGPQEAFRAYAQQQYLQSPLSKSWPPGMLEKINAL